MFLYPEHPPSNIVTLFDRNVIWPVIPSEGEVKVSVTVNALTLVARLFIIICRFKLSHVISDLDEVTV